MLVKAQHMFSVLDTHVMYVRQHICRPVISPRPYLKNDFDCSFAVRTLDVAPIAPG